MSRKLYILLFFAVDFFGLLFSPFYKSVFQNSLVSLLIHLSIFFRSNLEIWIQISNNFFADSPISSSSVYPHKVFNQIFLYLFRLSLSQVIPLPMINVEPPPWGGISLDLMLCFPLYRYSNFLFVRLKFHR